MRTNTVSLIPTLVASALLASIGMACAQTEILTFDDLSFVGAEELIPNSYGGLQWNNFWALNTVVEGGFGTNGAVNGVVSLNNVAFNGSGNPASFSGPTFNLNSGYLMAAWHDGLQVEVQGFVGTTLTYDNTYTVGTQGSTLIHFNYAGVDKVEIISSGGTSHGFNFGDGFEMGMDNLSVTFVPVPEPSTFALAGLAVFIPNLRRSMRWKS